MLFNSLTFVVFFAIVLIVHNLPLSWRKRKLNLLIASYLFYAAWNPPLIVLLWISTLVDWFCGNGMARFQSQGKRRLLLAISLIVNLGLLSYFKYGSFILENFIFLAAKVGIQYQPAPLDILLPIGISFYTFQTITYTFDIYRRQMAPVKSFLDYALFVTYFPQLVAGPIVRASQFLPQCPEPPKVSRDQFAWGLCLLTLGLFQKIVIADGLLSGPADTVFGAAAPLASLDAWVGTLAFSGQIFCDFAGYSTCAIGASLCLGFLIPNNFRYPYAAIGFSDFWRRWHISLSSWLRDYLYISMGGNRKGRLRTYFNLMMTMLIGGLWHGASWKFVVWGGLHGVYLWVERALRAKWGHVQWVHTIWAHVFLAILTNALVCITWVFFRADNIGAAWQTILAMFGAFGAEGAMVLATADIVIVLFVYLAIMVAHFLLRHTTHEAMVEATPWWLVGLIWSFMLVAIILTQGGGDAFIYFQF